MLCACACVHMPVRVRIPMHPLSLMLMEVMDQGAKGR